MCHYSSLQDRSFGERIWLIVQSRKIRQGDPLSSYLFLICMEGLKALIQDYERRRLITGIKIAMSDPVLSHMFFADDSYIYCKANETEANHINLMLQIFEKASGQQINKLKSSVLFSYNTVQEVRGTVCNTLGFQEAS